MVTMPEISRFFGIVIRMYFDDHGPPHIHVEYQGQKAVFAELQADWDLAQNGCELRAISPLE
jgi:hypothetical protein